MTRICIMKSPPSTEPTEQQIQHVAYYIWEAKGKPAGSDLEIWLAAKEWLKHRLPAREAEHRGPIQTVGLAVNEETMTAAG